MAWAAVAIALLLLGPALRAAPVKDLPSRRGFTVYASDNSFPYSFREGNAPVEGFAVDLLDAVARVMDADIHRLTLPSDDARVRFSKGGADFEQMFAMVPGRESYAEFSVPYLVLKGAIFVRKGDKRFLSIDELRERHAVIASPDQGYQFALDSGVRPENLVLASASECIEQLSSGKVDAVLLARLTGMAEGKRARITNVESVGPPVEGFTVKFCFAAHRGDTRLIGDLNESLAIVHQSGEFSQIYQKWFAALEPADVSGEALGIAVASALAVGLAVAIWGLLRQRHLRRRISAQAEELAESRSFLAEAQRFARIGHWQYRNDRKPAAMWSEETYRIMGKDFRGPVPTTEEASLVILEADQPKWNRSVELAWKQGVPFNIDVVIEPDRGVVRTVNIRGRPLRGSDDTIVGVFGVIQDVTTWRAAEMALRESEQLLRALYDNMPQALGVVERQREEWLIVSLNPAAADLLGGASTSGSREFSQLGLSADTGEAWPVILDRCVDQRLPIKMDARSTDGRRAMAMTLVPLEKAHDRFRCCFLVEDVSERKQRDAEISQGRRLRAIGELVGGIAHEFNNLLTPILLKSEQLQEDHRDKPGLAAELKIISEAATRSAALTRRLLTFGRKDEGRPELVNVEELIKNNVELLRDTIDRRIRIISDVAGDLPKIYLSGWDLHQILLNLLLNARDTLIERLSRNSDPKWEPTIWITAASVAPGSFKPFAPGKAAPLSLLRLTIRDNGTGMPPEVMERIFEPFFTTKPVGSGTGLGLATTCHMVTEFGGRIEVDSVDGQGTTFLISLPVDEPPSELRLPEPVRAVPVAPRESLRILLAEDEESIAKLMLKMLRNKGHAVTAVGSGSEAWSLISGFPKDYDALIMDLNMPGLTGLELARKLAAIRFGGAMMVMTGRVTDEDQAELEALGVGAIVQKPFTVDVFVDTFNRVMAQRRG